MKKIFTFLFMVLIVSCKKENLPPTCVITAPENNSTYSIGDVVTISVDAEDSEGGVDEVKIFINNVGLASIAVFPYNLEFDTQEYDAGELTIRASARDNEGLETSDEIRITISASLPDVSTTAIDSVTNGSAVLSGEVISDGGLQVVTRGICWGTISNPTLSNDFTTAGSGIGEFESKLENLLCTTEYYARAYATNSQGTSYGEQIIFVTGICYELPTVTTKPITELTDSSAISGGIVTYNGGANIRARGVCWSTTPAPTIDDNHTTDGVGGGGFTSVLQGLSCETTYYVRAYATNLEGISYGDEVSFTTKICPTLLPVVTTASTTDITELSATSGGEVTDNGGGEVTARGVCWSTSENPTLSDDYSNEGTGTGSYTSSLSGLSCATTYYVRAYTINAAGTSYGNQVNFTTSACTYDPPTVSTVAITGITNVAALGGGNVSNDGGAPVTSRGICWSTSPTPTLSDSYTDDGTGVGSYTSAITGLTCAVTYYVRAYATNLSGTTYGDQETFTTSDCTIDLPTVTTSTISVISETGGTGGGDVTSDGGGAVTAKGICWSTTLNPTLADNKTVDGTGTGSFTSSLTGLACATVYYVRGYASNSAGTTYGEQVSFTTSNCPPGMPIVLTSSASSITENSAQGGGNVTDNGGSAITARGVCWSTSQNPTISNSRTTDGSGIGSYISAVSGLTCNTTYYVRAYATNSAGTSYGSQVSFTTGSCPAAPTVTTSSVSSITRTTVQGGGNVTASGSTPVTARGVCWSTSQNPTLASSITNNGTGTGTFSSSMSSLSCGTTYYVRAYATNSVGTTYGNQVSFTSGSCSTVPAVTTTSVSSISQSSAQSGGDVTSDGGATVTAKGVCWSTSSNPTISDNTTSDGSGTGSYSSSITGLTCNTTYYVRAYATNSVGTSYGSQVSFTTSSCPIPPAVTTTSISSITENSAQSGGNVSSDGGATVTAKGVCWSTSSNPEITDNKTIDGSGTGSYSSAITGLSSSTTYYVRAYATNSEGTSYGSEESFTTSTPVNTVTDIDGNVYTTVQIGSQVWMAENLKTTRFSDGTAIPLVENTATWSGLTNSSKAYCYYDNSAANGNTYGALYTWAAAVNGTSGSASNPSGIQGACPSGWHLPSDAEWKELEISLGMSPSDANIFGTFRGTDEGGKLKETGTTHWNSPNTGATDEVGFTGLPGASRSIDGSFTTEGTHAYFWTATISTSSLRYYRRFFHDREVITRGDYYARGGFSVRCVED